MVWYDRFIGKKAEVEEKLNPAIIPRGTGSRELLLAMKAVEELEL